VRLNLNFSFIKNYFLILIENANKLFKLPASIPPTSFFSVYDGHGGVEAAKFTKDYLAQNIFYSSKFRNTNK